MSAGEHGTTGGHRGTPGVLVAATIAVPAGSSVTVTVTVTNTADRPARQTLTVLGLDAAWVGEPIPLGTVAPGETVDVAVPITPERGAIGAGYPFVVAVESQIIGGGTPLLGLAESTLVVDGRERLSLTVDPSTSTAVSRRRIRVQLTNPGRTDREIVLSANSGTSLRIGLDRTAVLAPAGRTVTVDGRIRIRRPRLLRQGGAHSFSIIARSSGAPEHAAGTVRSVPLVRGAVMKAVSLVLVLALWAGAAFLLIPRVSDTFSAKNDATPTAASTAPSSGGAGASSAASGSTPAEGAGTDGTPGGDDNSGGTGTDGSAPPDATTAGAQLVGTIAGPDPSGVTAQLQPTSLVAASEAGATAADTGTSQGLRAADAPLGKIPEQAVQPVSPRQSAPEGTRSGKDGSFAFGGIQAPGYYLLTLSKKGLQTQRFVVDSSTLVGADPMQVTMVAGSGTLTGMVTGPDGPIGAASVEITDGTIALSTSSVSAGDGVPATGAGSVGSWSAAGLSTPGTYLITVSAPGYGTSSALVKLATGGAGTADLTLQRGVAAVTGSVTGRDALGNLGGLGGISISLTDGKTTRTATTVTSGPVGAYVLAGVPAPGEYTMTVSGAGYQTQTRTVTIGEGVGAVTADVALVDAMGSVTGRTLDENAAGISGVGLTLVGDSTSYKTMSTSAPAGRYRFTGVAPGTYLLTATQFGRAPASTTVTVTAPDVSEQDLTLPQDADLELVATARIRGRVVDASTDGALTCTRVAVPGRPCRVTVSTTLLRDTGAGARTTLVTSSAGPEEDYTLPSLEDTANRGLAPGLYTVRISAPGYESTQIQVQVSQGQVTVAQQVGLQPLARLSGTVTTRVGTPTSPTCVLSVATGVSAPEACTVAADGDSCIPAGGAVVGVRCAVVAADGSYQIVGLVHGSYRVTVLPTDPEYRPLAPATVQLALAEDAAFNGVLDRLGRATVTVFRPDQSTLALSPSADTTVTLTPRDGAIAPPDGRGVTGANGQASFTGLNGAYAVTAGGASATIRTALNQTTSVSIVVTSQIGPVVGRITTSVDGQIVPVDGVAVTIGGIIGFSGQTPVTGTVSVTTDANGCYAIVPEGYAGTPVLTSPDCPAAVGAAARAVLLDSAGEEGSLVALPITLSVDASGTRTEEYASQAFAVSGTGPVRTVPVVVVSAKPSPAGSQILRPKPDGVQPAVLVESRIVVSTRPAGAGAVAVTSDPAGNLTFVDPSLGTPGLLVPGRYTLTASLDDFVSGTADLLCPLGRTCVLVQPGTDTPIVGGLELKVLPSMDVTVHVLVPSGETVDPSGLAGTVAAVSATGAGTLSLTATDPVIETGGYRIRFNYRDSGRGRPQVAVPGTYDLSFSLNGYSGATSRVTCGADYTVGCTQVDLTLKPFPRLAPDARVVSQPGSVTVQSADVQVLSRPAGSGAITVTVAGGVVGWQEAGLPADVIRPGSYQFQVSADGQDQSSPASYTCDPEGDLIGGQRTGTCSPPWELTRRTDLKFTFVDAQGPVNDVRIVLSGSGLTAPATAATQATGNTVTIQGVVALPSVAAGYSLRVQAAGHQFQDLGSGSAQISCTGSAGTTTLRAQPGGTTSCTVTLNVLGQLLIATSESITPPGGTTSTNVLGSVALSAQRISDANGTALNGQPVFSGTTSTSGTVSITGRNDDEGLLAGTYRVSATADGHDAVTGTVRITQTGGVYTMTAVTGSFPITGNRLQVVLPVTEVDVKLNLASVWDVNTPLLQPLTATFTGAGGTYTCVVTSTGSTPTGCAVDDATGKYVYFTGINPGTYQLTIDPPNAANPTFFSFSQRIDVPRATATTDLAEFTVYLYVRSNTQVVKVLDAAGQPFTSAATIAFLKDGPSGKIPATDYDGNEITRTVNTGSFTFTQVPDGRYYIQITATGYDTVTSDAIDLIKFLTPVQPQREFTLTRSGRSVSITVTSTAGSNDAGGVVDQSGTAILLKQASVPGNLPVQDDNGPLTVSGATGGPYTTTSSGALNTGNWTTSTVAQAGISPVSPATTLPTGFSSAAPAFSVTPGNAPLATTIVLQQRVLSMRATFSPTTCTAGAPLPSSMPFVVTRSGGGAVTVNAAVDNATGTVSAAATLPAGTYTWAPDLTGITGYTFTAAAASTLTVPAGSAANSLAPVASTATLTYATGPVTPTLTVDGTAQSGTTVTAFTGTAPDTTSPTLTTGVAGCLTPQAWKFRIATATLLLPDRTGTVPAAAPPLDVPFVGYTITPTVSLQAVAGRPADAVARSYTLTVSAGATTTWTGTVTIPAGQSTVAGPTLTVPAGSYTTTVSGGPTGDVFAATGSAPAVDPSTAAGTETPTVTLPYLQSTLVLTATMPTGVDQPSGGTVTLIPTGTGATITRTLTGDGPYALADLPPATYDLYLEATVGGTLYTASSAGLILGAGTSTPLTLSPTAPTTGTLRLASTALTGATATFIPTGAGAVITKSLSGTGKDVITDLPPDDYDVWVQGTSGGVRLGSSLAVAVPVGFSDLTVTPAASSTATLIVRPDSGAVSDATVTLLRDTNAAPSTTTTGASGQAVVPGLPTARTYQVTVGSGTKAALVTNQTLPVGLTILSPALTVPTGAQIILRPVRGTAVEPGVTLAVKQGTTAVTGTTTTLTGGFLLWTNTSGPTASHTFTVTKTIGTTDYSGTETVALGPANLVKTITLTAVPAGP